MTLITFTRHLRSILRRKEIHLQSVTAPQQIINKYLHNTIYYPGNVSRYCTNTGDLKYHEIPVERIRNFGIIAHVDHGKSTLADRLLEITGTVKKVASAQLLDSLQVERERGITVKAQTCSLLYEYNGETYLLNLIDTPGHVDFSNEVARSLSICDGVLLLVDANQGVQAQTVANYYLAKNKKLEIVPVVNKIDLPRAQPDAVCQQMKTVFNINPASVLKISAKMGIGIDDVLTSIVEEITPPDVDRSKPFRSLLFDSTYDKYRGVLNMIFVKEGTVAVGDHVTFHHTGKSYEIRSLSLLRPEETPVQLLKAGQVGLLACNMRSSAESIAGDTIHLKTNTSAEALPGFQAPQPIVFAGIYPAQSSEFLALRGAIDKLCLNDSGVSVTPDSSAALGRGWRAGFLGLLHLDVFCQRLQQEFDAEPIITAPSVTYQIDMKPRQKTKAKGGGFEDAETVFISNAAHWPDPIQVEEFYEPFVNATIITPTEAIGSIIALCVERRGLQSSASINVDAERVMLTYQLPLAEIIHDFHDRIKAMSSGYASFNYIDAGFRSAPLVKIDILLNGVPCVELSRIVHAMKATSVARQVAALCAELIPRQMIQINVQACVGAKILARETIKPYRKDVTAKLYGGDVTRRMKLLRNQAEGKKKMRSLANVKVPHDTFINILKR